jgi:hypothetical protein
MANQVIMLSSAQNMGATADQFVVNRINLKADDSGDWGIGVSIPMASPERTAVDGVRINENHRAGAQVVVTRAEIAAVAGITVEEVQDMTIGALKTIVTQVALGKVLAAFGLSI